MGIDKGLLLCYNKYRKNRKEKIKMMMIRFVVTFRNGDVDKVRLFKTLDEAQNFIYVCRKLRPQYSDFKIKSIKI